MRPNLFVVGAPKCGTTSLHYYLAQHPEIFMSNPKEPYFFGKDNISTPFPLEMYLALFSQAGDAKWRGEATPHNLVSESAAEEIKEFEPEARIIIMLRNPVDLLYSYYYELLWQGYPAPAGVLTKPSGPPLSFEEALANENERLEAYWSSPDIQPKLKSHLFYRDLARFTPQVQRYVEGFGWEQMCVILYDDFVKDLATTYKHILNFLNVDEEFQPDYRIQNSGRVIKNRFLHWLLRNAPAVKQVKGWMKAIVPESLGRNVMGKLYKYNTSAEARPEMLPETRQSLQDYYHDDVQTLSELLKEDLVSRWRFNGVESSKQLTSSEA